MSSPYPVLDKRPIDQWKVTELKEELKRRRLPVKGLKDDLIKRLDKALRLESETAKDDADNGTPAEPEIQDGGTGTVPPLERGKSVDQVESINEMKATNALQAVSDASEKNDHHDEAAVDEQAAVDASKMNDHDGSVREDSNVDSVATHPSDKAADDEQAAISGSIREDSIVDPVVTHPSENVEKVQNMDQTQDTDVIQAVDHSSENVDPGVDIGEAIGEDVGLSSVGDTGALRVVDEAQVCTSVETISEINVSVVCEVGLSGEGSYENNNQNDTSEVGLNVGESDYMGYKEENSASQVQLETEDAVADRVENHNTEQHIKPEDPEPHHEVQMLDSSIQNKQVPEVTQILGKSDSISTDSVSINEKNEIKDNITADNMQIELDYVKPENVQPLSSNVLDHEDSHPIDVEEPNENRVTNENSQVDKVPFEDIVDDNANADISKKDDGTVVYSEKLNLDRSSGDDSMEEDALDGKPIDSKFNSDVGDNKENTSTIAMNEDTYVDVVDDDLSAVEKVVHIDSMQSSAAPAVKRKLHDKEPGGNNETSKRQRRWNSESLKVPEARNSILTPSTTPKDSVQPAMLRHTFSRSNSAVSDEKPKERVVPPSEKPPTNSLRIDRFLRPFTLKAVQELLAKSGTVNDFWMDHIKTHCYVTYSSVEEAIETRNALYNLQWPPNGGRLLVADFVDPQEVKLRVEAPPTPAAPVSAAPVTVAQTKAAPANAVPSVAPAMPVPAHQPQPSPRNQVPRQLPPPPCLPPPPPLRELPLPPPPPLSEKQDPPIVTLDDLFMKTKATPRIYYLPLSEEQVAAKRAAVGQRTKQ